MGMVDAPKESIESHERAISLTKVCVGVREGSVDHIRGEGEGDALFSQCIAIEEKTRSFSSRLCVRVSVRR